MLITLEHYPKDRWNFFIDRIDLLAAARCFSYLVPGKLSVSYLVPGCVRAWELAVDVLRAY